MLVHRSGRTKTTLHRLGIVKLLLLTVLVGLLLVTELITISRLPVRFIVTLGMLIDDCAEARLRTFNWTINEGQLCNIVFVDHAQNGSFLDAVDLGVFQFSLVNRGFLIKAVGWNQLRGIVFRNSMESVQGLWQPSRCQTVNGCLERSSLNKEVTTINTSQQLG